MIEEDFTDRDSCLFHAETGIQGRHANCQVLPMSVSISCYYRGSKKTELVHELSGTRLVTDAPRDNQGEGTSFSPTDLFAASLLSCMMTTIAIVVEREGINVTGMHGRIEKHMAASPRRVGSLPAVVHLPRALTPEQRALVEQTAHSCPVTRSISPGVTLEVGFVYDV